MADVQLGKTALDLNLGADQAEISEVRKDIGFDSYYSQEGGDGHPDPELTKEWERRIRLKTDLRLCTIAGILCGLNLLDSGIMSSASVTSMFTDLQLYGTRYSVSIFIFTISSVVFQLPSTIAVRFVGPRLWFAVITFCFGLVTLCTAFIRTWREMIALRVLLGICMSGIYPGLTYLISTWYTRREQQVSALQAFYKIRNS